MAYPHLKHLIRYLTKQIAEQQARRRTFIADLERAENGGGK